MTILVGREAELASAVQSLRSGRGVVVAGAAGVGKTALAGAVTALLDTGRLENISLALWSERSPAGAFAGLAEMREAGRDGYRDELDTVEALLTLFTGRAGQALRLADAALARGPVPNARVRALTVRLGALHPDRAVRRGAGHRVGAPGGPRDDAGRGHP